MTILNSFKTFLLVCLFVANSMQHEIWRIRYDFCIEIRTTKKIVSNTFDCIHSTLFCTNKSQFTRGSIRYILFINCHLVIRFNIIVDSSFFLSRYAYICTMTVMIVYFNFIIIIRLGNKEFSWQLFELFLNRYTNKVSKSYWTFEQSQ